MRGTWKVGAVAAGIASALTLTATVAANAVGPGETLLRGDAQTLEGLADLGIAVEPTGRARLTPKGIRMPVIGGDLSPEDDYRGLIGHGGGLVFRRAADGAEVKFSKLAIAVHRRGARVFARSGNETLRLMVLDGGVRAIDDNSFELWSKARLARPAADLLSETFGTAFEPGTPLGRTRTKARVDDSPSERF